MTPAVALLADLRARGVELVATGDRLRFRPASAVSEDTRDALRAHKAELLALLAPRSYSYPWPDSLPGLGRRTVGSFARCLECRAEWSWVRYGDRVLCLTCAKRAGEAPEGNPRSVSS